MQLCHTIHLSATVDVHPDSIRLPEEGLLDPSASCSDPRELVAVDESVVTLLMNMYTSTAIVIAVLVKMNSVPESQYVHISSNCDIKNEMKGKFKCS